MKDPETYQLEYAGAKFYEAHFISSIFGPWAQLLVNELDLADQEALLDVACGTGIVARTAFTQAGLSVTGLDLNAGMLKVAQEQNADITWVNGSAEDLPFADDSFHKVACQFGLMFFPNPEKAIAEMLRVRKTPGKVIISVWDQIEANGGYADLLGIVQHMAGPEAANILRSPFQLGDTDKIEAILQASGLSQYNIQTLVGPVSFPSIEAWVDCDVKASPIIKNISAEQYAALQQSAQTQLQQYETEGGKVQFNMSAHFIILE